jgi:hypothetical protein
MGQTIPRSSRFYRCSETWGSQGHRRVGDGEPIASRRGCGKGIRQERQLSLQVRGRQVRQGLGLPRTKNCYRPSGKYGGAFTFGQQFRASLYVHNRMGFHDGLGFAGRVQSFDGMKGERQLTLIVRCRRSVFRAAIDRQLEPSRNLSSHVGHSFASRRCSAYGLSSLSHNSDHSISSAPTSRQALPRSSRPIWVTPVARFASLPCWPPVLRYRSWSVLIVMVVVAKRGTQTVEKFRERVVTRIVIAVLVVFAFFGAFR